MNKFLYFSAAWCNPCKTLGPIMGEVAQHHPVQKIDVDSDSQMVTNFGIRNVPTVILVDPSGKELARTSGVQSKGYYINQYNNFK